jgi:hypothetical protein
MQLTRNITHLPLLVELKNNMCALAVVFVSVMSARLLKEYTNKQSLIVQE